MSGNNSPHEMVTWYNIGDLRLIVRPIHGLERDLFTAFDWILGMLTSEPENPLG